jgi:phage shock protein PspC (stress-responsive transcriptional regulator)
MEMNHTNKALGFWDSVRNLKKSATDKKIAGVCGGFGEYTPVPAWLWRALFLVLVFVWGTGIFAYVVFWICMPAADESATTQTGEISRNNK